MISNQRPGVFAPRETDQAYTFRTIIFLTLSEGREGFSALEMRV